MRNEDLLSTKNKSHNIEKILKCIILFLFILYFLICIKVMLLKYASFIDILQGKIGGFRSINLIPLNTFRSFYNIAKSYNQLLWSFSNIFGNILIIVPLGFCLPLLFNRFQSLKKTVLIIFIFSLCMETFQYVLYLGTADIDDIILNTLGGLLGYLVYTFLCVLKYSELKMYTITMIAAIGVFISGFIVAKEQFGSLLGLVHYTTVKEGNEKLPDTAPTISGTIYEYGEDKVLVYEGYITGANDPNIAYARKNEILFNDDTQYFLLSRETKGTKTIDLYKAVTMEEIDTSKLYTRVQIWTNDNFLAEYIVIDDRFSHITGESVSSSDRHQEVETEETKKTVEDISDTVKVPKLTSIEQDSSDAIDVPKSIPIDEVIEGYIRSASQGYVTIEIVIREYIEGGGLISSSTGIYTDIYYEQDVSLTVDIIKNGGSNVETRLGNIEDLAVGNRITATGIKIDDDFTAEKILIKIILH